MVYLGVVVQTKDVCGKDMEEVLTWGCVCAEGRDSAHLKLYEKAKEKAPAITVDQMRIEIVPFREFSTGI